jgi:hypothetical protein
VLIDKIQIEPVLIKLMKNAVEAMSTVAFDRSLSLLKRRPVLSPSVLPALGAAFRAT